MGLLEYFTNLSFDFGQISVTALVPCSRIFYKVRRIDGKAKISERTISSSWYTGSDCESVTRYVKVKVALFKK